VKNTSLFKRIAQNKSGQQGGVVAFYAKNNLTFPCPDSKKRQGDEAAAWGAKPPMEIE
jgi:hypothetical protein